MDHIDLYLTEYRGDPRRNPRREPRPDVPHPRRSWATLLRDLHLPFHLHHHARPVGPRGAH